MTHVITGIRDALFALVFVRHLRRSGFARPRAYGKLCKSFFVLYVGLQFLNDATAFNPLLTYTVRFKKFTMYPNISGQLTVNQHREIQLVNGYMDIDTKIDNVVGLFYRCNAEGVDCEYFQTWKLTDICSKLKEKNQIWSSWYGSFSPPMLCPIDKVHYKLINGTIEVGPLLILYPDATEYQWKVTQKFFSGDVYVGGYTIGLELFGYRKRIKSILNL